MHNSTYTLIDGEVGGPYTPEQLHGLLTSGKINDETQCCHEGTEDWKPFSELFSKNDSADKRDGKVLMEGNGYSIRGEDIVVGRDILALAGVLHAKVATERIERGNSRLWVIVSGFVLVVLGLIYWKDAELFRVIPGHIWTVGAVAALMIVWLSRSAYVAFRTADTFVEVRLTNDDSRMLHLSKSEAKKVADVINGLVAEQDAE